jgi:hypothetical protein
MSALTAAPAAVQESHLRVRVAGWSYSRHVVLRDGVVEMEIARTHCSHCSTCRARIFHCENALAGKPFERRSAGGGEYFILPYPAVLDRDPRSVANFLSEVMRLRIVPAE